MELSDGHFQRTKQPNQSNPTINHGNIKTMSNLDINSSLSDEDVQKIKDLIEQVREAMPFLITLTTKDRMCKRGQVLNLASLRLSSLICRYRRRCASYSLDNGTKMHVSRPDPFSAVRIRCTRHKSCSTSVREFDVHLFCGV
jgi:hypothetical protein